MGSQNYDTIESWYFKAPVAVPGVLGNKEAGGKGMGGSYPWNFQRREWPKQNRSHQI